MDVVLLGEIQDLISDVNTNIAASKTVIDTISSNTTTIINNTKVNNTASETGSLSQKLASIISYTKTNNTASTTGTLSQKVSQAINNTAATTTENISGTLSAKLTYLINRRNRIIKPSSTNLKQVTNNLTTANTAGGKTSGDKVEKTSAEAVIAFHGTYRLSATGVVNVVSKAANVSYGSTRAKAHVYFYKNGSQINYQELCSTTAIGTSAAATKTYDVMCVPGDKLKVKLVCEGLAYEEYVLCIGNEWFVTPIANAKLTDFSIRGTIAEVSNSVIV